MNIYYINLDRRRDRRTFMEQQFAQLGLTATRIEAITPADLSAADLASYCDPMAKTWVTPVGLSCVLSHERAFQRLLETDDPFAVVFEDDAVLSSRLPAFLAAFEASKPDTDVVRFETSGYGVRVKQTDRVIDGIELAVPFSWEGGAAGYIIGRRAARLLVGTPTMRGAMPDLVLFDPFGSMGKALSRLQTLSGLCMQAQLAKRQTAPDLGSDLNGAPKPARRRPETRAEAIGRQLKTLWRREIVAGGQRTLHQLLGAKKRAIPFLP